MSTVVRFLETLGSTSAAARLSNAEYATAVAALDIDIEQRNALLNRDHVALNNLLGGRPTMFFGLFPAENEPEPAEVPQEDLPEKETPPGEEAD